jgi:hypothetical protein
MRRDDWFAYYSIITVQSNRVYVCREGSYNLPFAKNECSHVDLTWQLVALEESQDNSLQEWVRMR